ncbi:MAG: cupin domain-containing protein [Candidatus Sericytochromatia bacterium]|nr:cupin domain-containing protein [Candidatus Sericytochromatia bacterium]
MSFHVNIIKAAMDNTDFRRELFTTPLSQVVVMSVLPGDDIGLELHHLDQHLAFVAGTGTFVIGEHRGTMSAGDLVSVPAGNWHNFVNTGNEPLKLYTVYAPAEHAPGTIHRTKADAEAAEAAEHAQAAKGGATGTGFTVGSLIGQGK